MKVLSDGRFFLVHTVVQRRLRGLYRIHLRLCGFALLDVLVAVLLFPPNLSWIDEIVPVELLLINTLIYFCHLFLLED